MKKFLITALVMGITIGGAMAQDSVEGMKATGGNVTLEANVNLFGGGSAVSLSNSLNQIRVRYFLADDLALRIGANITLENRTDFIDRGSELEERKRSHFGFSIMPGIEKHFTGTNRLSPYIGAEVGIAIDSRKEEVTYGTTRYDVEGTWLGGPRGNTQILLNGIGGFDFYVARHLYVGYEVGFGLAIRNEAEVEVDRVRVSDKSSNFNLSPNIRNGVRVGFVF